MLTRPNKPTRISTARTLGAAFDDQRDGLI
jgi:hypothetical protein